MPRLLRVLACEVASAGCADEIEAKMKTEAITFLNINKILYS
jgi:hypothetical protein